MTQEEKVELARKLLERLMAARGYSRLDMDKKIGRHRGYVSQLLSGRLELRLEHIVALLDAMGIEPLDYFELLFPRKSAPRPERQRLEEILLAGLTMPPAPPPAPAELPSMPELERLVEAAVSRALREQQPAPSSPPSPSSAGKPSRRKR